MEKMKIEQLNTKEYILLDIRQTEEFVLGFIPESVHIPLEKLGDRALLLLGKDKQVVIIGNENVRIQEAAKLLNAQGNTIAGVLEDGIVSWQESGKPLDMIIMIDPDEYAMDQPFDKNLLLVDVRSADDFAELHAEQAISMPLNTFGDVVNIASVEDDQNVYVHCGGGSSAITAASLFKKQGFHSIRVIEGGFNAMQSEPRIKMITESKPDNDSDVPADISNN